MHDSASKFSKTTIYLHWVVALGMIGLLSLGVYMTETKTYSLYALHKSLGVLMLGVILVRVFWRVIKGWPESLNESKKWEYNLAKTIHWMLIIGTVMLPVSGMMMSGAGGRGIFIFGFELFALNTDPEDPKSVIPLNETLANIGEQLHWIVGYIFIVSILLHIAGAIKHHVVNRDGTLSRMLGKTV